MELEQNLAITATRQTLDERFKIKQSSFNTNLNIQHDTFIKIENYINKICMHKEMFSATAYISVKPMLHYFDTYVKRSNTVTIINITDFNHVIVDNSKISI